MDFFTNMWEVILSGKEWRGEIKNRTKSGITYWVYSVIKPIFKDDVVCGFTSISTNITDKKHVEYLSITDDMVHYIQEVTAQETKLMQNIFYLLYIQGKKDINIEMIDSAVDVIIDAKDSSYRMILDTLPASQKTALKVIGKYPSGFYIQEVFDEYGISKQSLQSAINTLFKKEIIDKENDKYFVPERTFELWIKKLYS